MGLREQKNSQDLQECVNENGYTYTYTDIHISVLRFGDNTEQNVFHDFKAVC